MKHPEKIESTGEARDMLGLKGLGHNFAANVYWDACTQLASAQERIEELEGLSQTYVPVEALEQAEAERETLKKLLPEKMLFDEVFMERFHSYTRHKRGCTFDDSTKGDICTCGLQALINQYHSLRERIEDG